MKLSQWAREQGLIYKGAWRMWRAGQLPVPAEPLPTEPLPTEPLPTEPLPTEPLPTGTIMVKEIKTPAHAVALYAGVFLVGPKKGFGSTIKPPRRLR
jgi:hypothetical protein